MPAYRGGNHRFRFIETPRHQVGSPSRLKKDWRTTHEGERAESQKRREEISAEMRAMIKASGFYQWQIAQLTGIPLRKLEMALNTPERLSEERMRSILSIVNEVSTGAKRQLEGGR